MKIALLIGMLATVALASEDLDANAGCVGGRVVIQNLAKEHWTDVKILVNERILSSGYVYVADLIPATTTMRYLPGLFTLSDGTRLDLSRIACKTINIHATVDGKRKHWNGAYK